MRVGNGCLCGARPAPVFPVLLLACSSGLPPWPARFVPAERSTGTRLFGPLHHVDSWIDALVTLCVLPTGWRDGADQSDGPRRGQGAAERCLVHWISSSTPALDRVVRVEVDWIHSLRLRTRTHCSQWCGVCRRTSDPSQRFEPAHSRFELSSHPATENNSTVAVVAASPSVSHSPQWINPLSPL